MASEDFESSHAIHSMFQISSVSGKNDSSLNTRSKNTFATSRLEIIPEYLRDVMFIREPLIVVASLSDPFLVFGRTNNQPKSNHLIFSLQNNKFYGPLSFPKFIAGTMFTRKKTF